LDFTAAREPTRRQWRWRVGRRAATVPPVPEGFLTLFWDVLGYPVIFKVFNVIFV
jgi:hypothetical protein